MDDEPSVLSMTARILRMKCGYEANTALSGEVALTMHPLDHVLIITDVVMGNGMTGFDLARQILALADQAGQAPPSIIVRSGQLLPNGEKTIEALKEDRKEGTISFLAKPCDNQELIAAVKAAIEAVKNG